MDMNVFLFVSLTIVCLVLFIYGLKAKKDFNYNSFLVLSIVVFVCNLALFIYFHYFF